MPFRQILWGAAGVSLAAGVWLSLDPARLADVALVGAWAKDWRAAISPFAAEIGADYPPWALVTLAPLTWIPDALRAPAWIAVNLALALFIVRALTRDVPASDTRRWLVPALLCVVSFRTLNQFSLLSLGLALAGATARSPVMGGLWLGLALMKPQVGGVIWIAHLCLRDWRRVTIAAAVPVVLTLVCAWGLGQTPLRVLQDYASVLSATHGGSTPFVGHTELEAWLWQWFGTGTSLSVAAALAGPHRGDRRGGEGRAESEGTHEDGDGGEHGWGPCLRGGEGAGLRWGPPEESVAASMSRVCSGPRRRPRRGP